MIRGIEKALGLYLNPAQAAIVLRVKEKSQLQTLDRTAPTQPPSPAARSAPTRCCRDGSPNCHAIFEGALGCFIADLTKCRCAEELRRFQNLGNPSACLPIATCE